MSALVSPRLGKACPVGARAHRNKPRQGSQKAKGANRRPFLLTQGKGAHPKTLPKLAPFAPFFEKAPRGRPRRDFAIAKSPRMVYNK